MKLLIAGAGIGGLCAALCLEKSGHDVQVFEQTSNFSDLGAGIQCGANALRVFDYLGVLPQVKAMAVAPERVDFCAFDSGQVLHSADLGEKYSARYGAPYLHIHRADLHSILLGAINDRQIELTLDARVCQFVEQQDAVSVQLGDGREYVGDCLIAADGIRSQIRSQLVGGIKPSFSGNTAWRGMVSVNQLPTDFMDKVVTNFVGPNKHMVMYYLRQQQLVNFVGVVEGSDTQSSSWVEPSPWQDLKNDFDGWHPKVQTLIDAMQDGQCYRWALYEHQALNNWSSQRVTLLGDAAHATLPFLASGAAMAIEDARILQRALAHSTNVEQGLQCYQNNRLQRTKRVQQMSRQAGQLYHIRNPWLLKLAFKAIKFKSMNTENYLANYNPNDVPLL